MRDPACDTRGLAMGFARLDPSLSLGMTGAVARKITLARLGWLDMPRDRGRIRTCRLSEHGVARPSVTPATLSG